MPIPDPFFFLEVSDGKQYIFLDQREFGVFKEKNRNPAIEAVLLNPLLSEVATMQEIASTPSKLALFIIRTYGIAEQEIEVPAFFPLDMADFLRSQGIQLIPKNPLYPERAVKTEQEIISLRNAVQKAERAFVLIREILRNSEMKDGRMYYDGEMVSSEFLKKSVGLLFLQQDLENSEGLIISTGLQTAIPHHQGSGPIIPNQPIVCDIFPRDKESGYFADITRTFVKGEPREELKRMYEAVLLSQEEGVKMVKEGVIATEIHIRCSEILMEAGYDVWIPDNPKSSVAARSGKKGFTHTTGHGLGVELHENPALGWAQEKLVAGNVITVEPGLYYPEIGGVRIEDDILVTENGFENFTTFPKDEWIIP